jgi:ABC-type multidrug transport system fused ATPase/permease subunit
MKKSRKMSASPFTDKVAVLHDGILCGYGSHSELMKRENGIYREMFNIQASKYA